MTPSPLAARLDTWSPFGPGSSYQPGPMTPPPLAARLATWSLFGPGSWANRDQHWSRVIGPGCRTGTEVPYEPGQYGGLSTSEALFGLDIFPLEIQQYAYFSEKK